MTDRDRPRILDAFCHKGGAARPEIVCLCGSTRFRAEFETINRWLTLIGIIVLAPGVFGHAEGIALDEADKAALDRLHLAKIDLADRVFVVNPGGYVGDSTRAEIAYATSLDKSIDYFEPIRPDAEPPAVEGSDDNPDDYQLDSDELEEYDLNTGEIWRGGRVVDTIENRFKEAPE